MAFSIATIFSGSSRQRAFLSTQLRLLGVALAVFAILWVTNVRGPGTSLLAVVLYTLVIGNFTTPIMNLLNPLYEGLHGPRHWAAFLGFLTLTAVFTTALTVAIIVAAFRLPLASFGPQMWSSGRLTVLVILIVGTIRHLHDQTQKRLQDKNLELQRAVEIGNARSQQQAQELDKAREIQEGLLPKKIPQVRGFEIAGAWQPASVVGGDYFDVLKFSERRVGICIGDVVGKGLPAALLMANLQASFRAFAGDGVSPGMLVGKLNEVNCNNIAPDKLVTFCYCTIDTSENRLTYANAGHWPPILFHKSREAVPLREGGAPLGIFSNRVYENTALALESGDRLVLYTDGLTEAMDSAKQEFGERRLIELCSRNVALSASDLLAAIRKDVTLYCGGNFQDDFTLVVVAAK